jgi:steroid delta-isomerase-like uncharacterized protein
MSAEQNKATVSKFYEVLDRRDLDALDAIVTADFASHIPGNPGSANLEGFKGFAAGMFEAFPDITHPVGELVAEGNHVAVRITVLGNHRGPLMGMPATGKPMRIEAINLFRFVDGRIAEQWIQADMLGMMQQVGAIPTPEPAGA